LSRLAAGMARALPFLAMPLFAWERIQDIS
jgi:hypothetical protein